MSDPLSYWFPPPEEVTLALSAGQWIRVKKQLTVGEQRDVFARMIKGMTPGERVELKPQEVGKSQVVGYLLDWSLPVVIRGKSAADIGAIVDNLSQAGFNEILQAIQAHEAAMDAERDLVKNSPDGEHASSRTSSSAA